jgi:phage baseplate assembly protein W
MVASVSDPVQIPHFAFPFRFGERGAAVVIEQDSYEEIEQCVKVLMLTEIGERLEVPDFGILDVTFRNGADTSSIEAAAKEWDERVETDISEEPDRLNGMIRHLLVQVREGA